MGYIQDQEHFINYLNKAIRDMPFPLQKEDVLPGKFYITHIYDRGLADKFCWDIHGQGGALISHSRVLEWLEKYNVERYIVEPNFKHQFTKEFIATCNDLAELPGVYCFCNPETRILYIGTSASLGKRILSSFKRLDAYDRPVYLRYINTETCSDAALLEIYLIATIKPPLNADSKYLDKLTFTVSPIPDWSESILCNIILKEEQENGKETL
jgi:hypothetical protein